MLKRFRAVEVDQIYAYEMLQRFVMGLIGIFIPIYIASNGMSLQWVFAYIIISATSFAVLSIPASYIIARLGFKHSLILSYLFYFPAFLALRGFSLSPSLISFAAVAYGAGNVFHWVALHAEFAVDTEGKDRGKASGRIIGLPRVSQAIAPLAGGIIMASFGFQALISVSLVFLIISAIPLFMSSDHRDPMNYSISKFFDAEHRKFAGLFLLRGADIGTGSILFPLFVFYIVGGEINAGGVKSLASVGSIVFALTIGRISGKFERKKLIATGALLTTLVYIGRTQIHTSIEAFILSFAAGLFFMIYYIPLYSIYADIAEEEDVLEFYAFREFFLNLGKIIAYGIAMYFGLKYSLRTGFVAAFAYAGVATVIIAMYSKWVEKEDEEKRED